MRTSDATVIFDGDDTLWDAQSLYDKAKEEFYALIAQEGLDAAHARAAFDDYDRRNVKRLGFSKERFPTSMREFYIKLARRAEQDPDPCMADEAYHTGAQVFDVSPQLYPDAVPLLRALGRHYRLTLYSMGEDDVQQQRVDTLGLLPYFDHIVFPDEKTAEGLKRLVRGQGLTPSHTWMVGNSLRSDVHPAVESGLRAIWVERETWAYDEHPEVPKSTAVVSSLSEVPRVIGHVAIPDEPVVP